MLEIREKRTVTGKSIIDGVEACGFQAQIDSANPADIAFTNWQINKEVYKANRVACRADLAAFEDHVYAIQDAILADVPEDEAAE